MELISTPKDKADKARAKYQEVSSTSKMGETGSKLLGSQFKSEIVEGMSDLDITIITNPARRARTANKPWMLNLGLTQCKINIARDVNNKRNMVRMISIVTDAWL
jgi:hypothetical protein